MKIHITKRLFAFIITAMMFSVMPASVNAQRRCGELGGCPKGYFCLNGYCVKLHGGGNGHVLANGTTLTNIYYSGSQSATISFSLEKDERISAKIFDNTGQLVTTLADKMFEQGEHQLQWDAAGDNAGIYIVQFNASNYSDTKKIYVIK